MRINWRFKYLYWKYLRTRKALAAHVVREEMMWSGKPTPADELLGHINDLKGRVWW